ncbi:MAG: PepSY domain-containing protein [Holophagales bacterium]|nr:PepSY domain-containing protein [Holophagales bacterium]
MRRFARKLHRYAGLVLALFLVVVGLTGSALAFYEEIDAWLNPDLMHVPPGRPALSASELTSRIEAWDDRIQVRNLTLPGDSGHAARAFVLPEDPILAADPDYADELGFTEVWADPATGAVLGTRLWGSCCLGRAELMPFIYRLHYTLHAPGRIGVWLLGGMSVLWTFDCLIGFYLTLPRRRPFWSRWKKSWKVKTDAGAERTNYDTHRAGGLWLWGVLFLLAVTGVYFNLNREVFRPVVEVFSKPKPYPFETRETLAREDWGRDLIGFDRAIDLASVEAARRGWPSGLTRVGVVPAQAYYIVYFEPLEGVRSGLGSPIVYVDGHDGSLIGDSVPLEGSAADVIYRLQFPIHSGQILGLPGRIIIFLAGIVTAVLSVTGVVIWALGVRRRARNGHRRTAARPSPLRQAVPDAGRGGP